MPFSSIPSLSSPLLISSLCRVAFTAIPLTMFDSELYYYLFLLFAICYAVVVALQLRRGAYPPDASPIQVFATVVHPRRVLRISWVLVAQLLLIRHWRLFRAWTRFYAAPHGVALHKDLQPEGCRSCLDYYVPDPNLAKKKTILFVYGSGWEGGDKSMYTLIGKQFANKGYHVIIPNYNTHPLGSVRLMLTSLLEVLLWHYRCLAQPLHIVAHSAGSHLVHTLLLHIESELLYRRTSTRSSRLPSSSVTFQQLHQDYLEKYPTEALLCAGLQIRSVAGLAGPYHIGDHFLHEATRGVEWASCMWRIVGGHAHFERFSPTAVARVLSDIVSSSPLSVTCLRLAFTPYIRFHLLHGEQDIVVPVSSTQRLYDALTRLGLTVSSSFLMADHAEIMLALHATATVTCRSHVLDIVDTLHSQA
eukprot:m.118736 g.118736  ORF g.118736 m.118736 type:complete len:418 (+) comp15455_c0_seq6:97-1350(+)